MKKPSRFVAVFVLIFAFICVGISIAPTSAQDTPAIPAPLSKEDLRAIRQGILPASIAPPTATTFTVNSTNDTVDATPGDGLCADATNACSLRAAVMEANASAGDDAITLPAGTYTLTIPPVDDEDAAANGDLDITGSDSLVINGASGSADTIIDGGGIDRLFHLADFGGSVALNNLTLQNGSGVLGDPGFTPGGAIIVDSGTMRLVDVTIQGSSAGTGGAIFIFDGTLEIFNSAIINNSAQSGAGAIGAGSPGSPTLRIYNSTISGNQGTNFGGGLALYEGAAQLYHVTIANNTSANGGGLFNEGGTMTLYHTIVANNTAPTAPQCQGTITSGGYNLIANNTGCAFTSVASDLVGTGGSPIDPLLGALADNGGKTLTHATLNGSAARDVIPESACVLDTDQRGVSRPLDGDLDGVAGCDIGAFEFVLPFTAFSPAANETYFTNTVNFGWSALADATKYRIEVKGLSKPFTFAKNVTPPTKCQGSVCHLVQPINKLPNLTSFQWRVTAFTNAGESSTPWKPFKTQIPALHVIMTPDDYGMLSDTTPLISWQASPNTTSVRFKLFNAANKKLVKNFNFTASSTLTLTDICTGELCQFTTDQIGLTLQEGRSYYFMLETQVKYTNGAVVSAYKTQTPRRTFSVIVDPGLLTLPSVSELRGAER